MAITYKDAGVDINAGNEAVKRMAGHVRSTFNRNVLLDIGAFGGAFSATEIKKMKFPVLISSIDGVGTKTKIAALCNKWDTIGIDLVNHSCNDISACGAKPLFFLDYIASSKLAPEVVEHIISGMAKACRESNIALVAGETAEMPGVYLENETDLAGCIVGVVEKERIITGGKIASGDALIGLKSNGLHTNGYSLARKVFFEIAKIGVNERIDEFNSTLGEELLRTHRNYSSTIQELMGIAELHGIAHITGGGLYDNIERLLPEGLCAKIEKSKIPIAPVFRKIQQIGNVPERDMFRTFNMGIGLALIVAEHEKEKIAKKLKALNEEAIEIGRIAKGNRGVEIN